MRGAVRSRVVKICAGRAKTNAFVRGRAARGANWQKTKNFFHRVIVEDDVGRALKRLFLIRSFSTPIWQQYQRGKIQAPVIATELEREINDSRMHLTTQNSTNIRRLTFGNQGLIVRVRPLLMPHTCLRFLLALLAPRRLRCTAWWCGNRSTAACTRHLG